MTTEHMLYEVNEQNEGIRSQPPSYEHMLYEVNERNELSRFTSFISSSGCACKAKNRLSGVPYEVNERNELNVPQGELAVIRTGWRARSDDERNEVISPRSRNGWSTGAGRDASFPTFNRHRSPGRRAEK